MILKCTFALFWQRNNAMAPTVWQVIIPRLSYALKTVQPVWWHQQYIKDTLHTSVCRYVSCCWIWLYVTGFHVQRVAHLSQRGPILWGTGNLGRGGQIQWKDNFIFHFDSAALVTHAFQHLTLTCEMERIRLVIVAYCAFKKFKNHKLFSNFVAFQTLSNII